MIKQKYKELEQRVLETKRLEHEDRKLVQKMMYRKYRSGSPQMLSKNAGRGLEGNRQDRGLTGGQLPIIESAQKVTESINFMKNKGEEESILNYTFNSKNYPHSNNGNPNNV
eukprot:CAMPEP_0116981638 /NCGR_PEP_ID=MMETSP0467-20121206/59842_1 /TAXON_ID=283647 /ORGANISM="Mesodinium pulex, Strain SPMC105" /LENGTH=111 /DNA_ID=CAMNT_0004675929 /DNA_START=290 /DNA_END=625 /DNA_ORIENTATION=-